jgi:ubiquinone/menaquinone biosynthesis C-methylase UbiE
MHELRENAAVAETAFRDVVACCAARVRAVPLTGREIVVPDRRVIARQNKLERERLRRTAAPQEEEREFWSRYLQKYQLLRDVDDFQAYLRLAGAELGSIGPGAVLLDAGCGNGLFGLWVLRELLARREPAAGLPPVYVGVDLTSEGLREAWTGHARVLQEMGRRFGAAGAVAGTIYGQTDLDTWVLPMLEVPDALRFADHTFDKICCSLVLSYLQRPAELVREFHRVLRPGGRILLSSMKPHCDMSEIYRDFITQQLTAAELEAGRDLLREAGRIRLKEEHGFYQFYHGEELLAMLEGAGFKRGVAHLSFGGQAALAVAEK